MTQSDRHLTTEQLSAFLDHQLIDEELTECKAHVDTCGQCQQELADLRQTVSLLRALPQPVLPRSFVLPTTTAVAPLSVQKTSTIVSLEEKRSRRGLTGVVTAMRVASSLVAVIGICFILSGLLLPATSVHTMASTSTASQTYAQQHSANNEPHTIGKAPDSLTPVFRSTATTAAQGDEDDQANADSPTHNQKNEPSLKPDPAKAPAASQTTKADPFGFMQSMFFIFDMSTIGGRMGLGIVLCLAGCIGYMYFSQRRKRALGYEGPRRS
ncbi:hypothetical protein [Tengunoibacter tsumagoiensis]|uniref:Zinc-finger domain-containing protein n=1 Tax=Tengunoibacter tsumagoiensis TaxID=2014871 RepID=A0A402A451_9CHLR|nr:hypothetical protein [Tengunoibacter tsumagoiensis]GCE13836.1 hypothetical protein KTT_36950 [Tengunoibacter tsumagoiensis]